ncbi:hypothetical protein K466DRAFT_580924 [Polyporus arcularius HHB13444]|uniref:Uncharacterized protein n=1 Tax=Polyporus arcularius HHB13444 TaxID=1314778 RepID=A0A5C3PUH9_9APHY|nr:hypothetical protein K466DRAFT_580924 [Polyporus arcularius HHB13444]
MVSIMFREVYSEGSDGGTADCPRTSNDLARLPPVHTYAAAMHAYTNAIQFKLAVIIPCNPAQHWCIYLCTNVASISSYPFVLWPKEYWHSQHMICKSRRCSYHRLKPSGAGLPRIAQHELMVQLGAVSSFVAQGAHGGKPWQMLRMSAQRKARRKPVLKSRWN